MTAIMNSLKSVVTGNMFVAVLAVAVAAPLAHARDQTPDAICDALNQIMPQAPAHFAGMMGQMTDDDELFRNWSADVSLPGASDCEISLTKKDGLYDYSCVFNLPAGTTQEAYREAFLHRIETCLPDIKAFTWEDEDRKVTYFQGPVTILHFNFDDRGRLIVVIYPA